MSSGRPGGVIALAVFFIIFGVVVSITVIIVVITDMSALSIQWAVLSSRTFMSGTSYGNSMGIYELEMVGAIIVAAIYTVTAIGLLYMMNWGRTLALILSIHDNRRCALITMDSALITIDS
ncbi:MAG: hypothetical protein WED07_16140 [Candidatus Freyarchaeum deiterrae]